MKGNSLKRFVDSLGIRVRRKNQANRSPKFFCIGFNKTGTTSVQSAWEGAKVQVGDQRSAEKLLPAYVNSDFQTIIDYCQTAQAFQDFPFSAPKTFVELDRAFPDAKFILTVRDNSEQWLQSHFKFVEKRLGNAPTLDHLKASNYVWPGWSFQAHQAIFGEDVDFDDGDSKKAIYENHNKRVQEHFASRPEKLLVLNVADSDAMRRFNRFCDIRGAHQTFPWANKT